jgi:hypothetical protein
MHLGDEALAGAALQQHAQPSGDDTPLLSAGERAHLDECPRCLARLDDLRVALDAQRQGAADLADIRFSDTHLAAQRASILARLAARHAGARVLMFPSSVTPAASLPDSRRPAFRLVAATIAAGLFVGLMTTEALYVQHRFIARAAVQQADRARMLRILQNPMYHVESGPDAQPGDEADDRLLGEIETLARGRRNPALRALDDLTPRAPGNESRSHRYRER